MNFVLKYQCLVKRKYTLKSMHLQLRKLYVLITFNILQAVERNIKK